MREIFGATECGSIASRRTVEGEGWTLYDGVRLQHCAGSTEVVANGADAVPLADEIEMLGPDRFRLLGRRADMVKLGGRRASLSGLNRILTGLAGVRDGIFVVPDDLDQRSSARLLAVVVALWALRLTANWVASFPGLHHEDWLFGILCFMD